MRRGISTGRMQTVVLFMLAGFIVVAFRAQYLSVTVADEHLARGAWRTVSVVDVEGPRGGIVDRDGRPLAESVLAYSLILDPRHFFLHERDRLPALERIVAGRGRLDPDRLAAWATAEVASLPRSFIVERQVPPIEAEQLMADLRAERVSALYLMPEYRRVYPQRTLAGHTVGFTQHLGGQGLAGMERTFDADLQGRRLSWTVERDISRRPFLRDEAPDLASAAGHTVVLTLDIPLQRHVERELARTVAEYEAESGVVIVSRPGTGEILAMASWPPVDPNRGQREPQDAWLHPAVARVYEPGSTAKSFTFAMAFERSIIDHDTEIDTANGRLRVGGHWVRDIRREPSLPAWRAMALSSNIASLRIGMEIPAADFRAGLVDFGFGARPGTGLPGESAGLLRRTPWRDIEHANIAFGHGYAASPLQLHMATAAIANGGVRMRPWLVRSVVDTAGEPVHEFGPETAVRVVSREAAEQTTRTLIAATRGDGTGVRAAIPGFAVAGKTGTGELFNPETGQYEEDVLASFAGFAPAESPEVVVTVQILRPNRDIGYFGGVVAAPLFSRVTAEALRTLGVFPDPPAADPSAAGRPPSRDGAIAGTAEPPDQPAPSDADVLDQLAEGQGPVVFDAPRPRGSMRVPDLLGLPAWQAVARATDEGWDVELEGAGRVASQQPPPGERTPEPGTLVLLLTGDHDSPQGAAPESRAEVGP